MKKILIALALFGLTVSANAQTALLHYQPGNRLINGTQLNLMVDAVNNIQGNGTASAGTFTTLTSTGNISLANGKLTTLASTGATGITGATTITTTSALGLAVGRQGATAPVLRIDAGTASVATGVSITGAAAGSGVAVAAISSGTDENLTINAKGAGTVVINGTATGAITLTRATTLTAGGTFSAAANLNAHVNTGSTAPALTSCGGGSPAITGSDTAGIVTLGTTATGCVITFASAYTGTPYCVVSWIATPLASQSYVTSNVAITLTQTSTSSNKIQYVCVGPSGG